MKKTILILAANPKDTPQLRLDQEVREIDNGLERAQKREEFTIKQKWAARPVDVRRAMLDLNPNIVHFCGHGSGEEGITFEDEMGQAKLVNADTLAGFFELFADKVECVVLNACYSEVQAKAMAKHIPYVIGMSKAIPDISAIEFSVAFYDALGAGKTFEFAYKLACNAIQWENSAENLIPILITQGQYKQNKEYEKVSESSTIKVPEEIYSPIQELPGIVKDIDGNEYKVVKIGDQIWTEENLKVTRLNDGTPIPLVTNNEAWAELDTPGYCWYDNNIKNKRTYGAFYNWYTVNTGKLSPKGWHVPTDDEWETMENYLIANGYNFDGTTTVNKIAKSLASTTNWQSSKVPGSVGNTDYPEKRNVTGFSALPSGYRDHNGTFCDIGETCYWWSSTEQTVLTVTYPVFRLMGYGTSEVIRLYYYNRFGYSIRCVRD